jgi:membrane protein YqaA with SNARE-associated domain
LLDAAKGTWPKGADATPQETLMFRRLYDWTVAWSRSRHAPVALGTVSFVESSFFPIPADVLFIPMCATRPEKAMSYAWLASVTSVLGGMFGWAIGYFAFDTVARPLLTAMGKIDTFEALRADTSESTMIILAMLVTSGLSHIPPMKVVTILSGFLGFDFVLFVLSAIVARSARFFGLALLLRRYGTPILAFIEKRLSWVVGAVLVALVALIYVMKTHA